MINRLTKTTKQPQLLFRKRITDMRALLGLAALCCFSPPTLALACGGEGQRECKVWELFPSCKDGRVAYAGSCHTKNKCGEEGQRACMITEKFPSCNKKLVEHKGKCVSLNWDKLNITLINRCGEDIESVRLYDQADIMANPHAGSFLAVQHDQKRLPEDKEVTFDLVLPRNHADGSPWLYKFRVSNLCSVGGEASLSGGDSVEGEISASTDQFAVIPCDRELTGKDFWYRDISHGDVVNVCGEYSDARQ